MKNIFTSKDKLEILNRIKNLTPNSKKQWGKMTVNEMVCHCTDQIRVALGEIETKQTGNILSRTIAKQLVLLGLPAPKGKIKTFPEIDLALGAGTKPASFEKDIQELKRIIEELTQKKDKFLWAEHSVFGKLNRKQWGRLVYIHLNHHLTQFSV
ncbi:hypothetical protein BMS3Abin04_01963 [bacterium BMS3Abin04]|nr:hypothetical protein BMS3Abin04_01963 [bacterium BMS3Abin04]